MLRSCFCALGDLTARTMAFWIFSGRRADSVRTQLWCDRPLTSSSRTSNTWTGCSRVIPDARQPDESRSLSAGHMAKRIEIGNSVHDAKKDRLLSAVRMATAAFFGKTLTLPCTFWGCGNRMTMKKKPYFQSCCVFGDPSVMQKEPTMCLATQTTSKWRSIHTRKRKRTLMRS